MNERNFQSEIRDSIKYFYPVSHNKKIPDPSRHDINKTIKRPYDSYYIYKDMFVAMECKQMKKPEAFPFNKVEDHQIYNLLEVYQGFNHGIILINYRFNFTEKQMKQYGTDIKKHNFVLILDVCKYMELRYAYQEYMNRKSLPFQYVWACYMADNKMIMTWDKIKDKHVWNIKRIFDLFYKGEI